MILIIEIGLAIYGLIALFGGKMTLLKNKVVVGVPARLLGLLALTPLPAALMVILVYVVAKAPANPEQFAEDNKVTIALIEAGVVVGILVLVLFLASVLGVNPAEAERLRRRGRYEEDDRYDDDDRDVDRDRDRYDERDRDRDRPWNR